MLRPLVLLNTLRYLEPRQLSDRLHRSVSRGTVQEALGIEWRDGGTPVPPVVVSRAFSGSAFQFLNERIPFEGPDRWNPGGASRLWVYHLHYFQWIWHLPPEQALLLIEDWIRANPPGQGPGWEPYPVSLRLREWAEWLLAHHELPAERRFRLKKSLELHLAHLSMRLEYHLLGNHLLENAISLSWGGLRSSGAVASSLLQTGESLLAECLGSQILADGLHEERTPAYQALLTESLLRLGEVARQVPEGKRIESLAVSHGTKMLRALRYLSHPDGGIALFNDSVLNGSATASDFSRRFAKGSEARAGAWELSAGGFAGWNPGDGTSFLCDVGEPGPAHQPGHAHASALSFELSHLGERLLTDTGVHTYVPGSVRAHDRSTRAHNTLELDGRDQAELWSAFRCGERGRTLSRRVEGTADRFRISCSMEFPGRGASWYRHRRSVTGTGAEILFEDECEAEGDHQAVISLHIAPGHTLRECPEGAWEVLRRGRAVLRITGGPWESGESPYHPDFGVEIERPCLRATYRFRGSLRAKWSLQL